MQCHRNYTFFPLHLSPFFVISLWLCSVDLSLYWFWRLSLCGLVCLCKFLIWDVWQVRFSVLLLNYTALERTDTLHRRVTDGQSPHPSMMGYLSAWQEYHYQLFLIISIPLHITAIVELTEALDEADRCELWTASLILELFSLCYIFDLSQSLRSHGSNRLLMRENNSEATEERAGRQWIERGAMLKVLPDVHGSLHHILCLFWANEK